MIVSSPLLWLSTSELRSSVWDDIIMKRKSMSYEHIFFLTYVVHVEQTPLQRGVDLL